MPKPFMRALPPASSSTPMTMKPVDIEELVFKLQDACEHKALKGKTAT